MPVYDVRCKQCGEEWIDRFFHSFSRFKESRCSGCGGELEQFGRPSMRLVGVTPSRPLQLHGETVESNAAAAAIEAGGHRIIDPKSAEHRRMVDERRASADKKAQKHGFKDLRESVADAKKRAASEQK